tara:strand:+ start:6119 stop:6844 length:726 start_codon:yes stop_codon:yes gene_type:complete
MNRIFHFILNLIEFFYKKKLINQIKRNLPQRIETFFDIGAHKGETTIDFSKNFYIENAFLFEPNKKNFSILEKNLKNFSKIKNIYLYNFALGAENSKAIINEVLESSSSTINDVNIETNYFKRKQKILKFFNKNASILKSEIEIKNAQEFITKKKIIIIDIMKIDTEGYEFLILDNLKNCLKNVKLILFEHHYDLMIKKSYKFRDINNLLCKNNFIQIHKSKMNFRKSFEYIYLNKRYKID